MLSSLLLKKLHDNKNQALIALSELKVLRLGCFPQDKMLLSFKTSDVECEDDLLISGLKAW